MSADLPGLLGDVQRIAVLRPNAVGDFVFALPALVALRSAYPQARITLLGKPWHRDFLADRPGPVDEVLALPPVRGVGAGVDEPVDDAVVEEVVRRLRQRHFDLALQLYGGGRHSNGFVQRLGARLTAGLRADDAPPLDRNLHYEPWRNERARLLEAVALVGAAPVDLHPRLTLTARDHLALHAELPRPLPEGQPIAVLQPGATDARRQWPPERFAAVGDALSQAGALVVINGSPTERLLTSRVAAGMRTPAVDTQGRLSLSALAALLARAGVVVSNDTGPLHLAHALGTPTVGIFWILNLVSAQPLVAARHRFAFSARLHCPVCGAVNVRQRCEHQVPFVDEVGVDEVREMALSLLRQA